MICPPGDPSLDICPTQDQLIPQLLALLPRGRAWGTHDGGPQPVSTLYKFWYAVAGVWAWVHAAICALALEFFCATAKLTLDLWMLEYGLPDNCDPFPDLCVKVAAIGGDTCAYYQAVAAAIGWAVICPPAMPCALMTGCIEAGMALGGDGETAAVINVVVDLSASPAFVGVQEVGPMAGYLETGMSPACGPDLTALDCVLERIVHAEVLIVYTTIGVADVSGDPGGVITGGPIIGGGPFHG